MRKHWLGIIIVLLWLATSFAAWSRDWHLARYGAYTFGVACLLWFVRQCVRIARFWGGGK